MTMSRTRLRGMTVLVALGVAMTAGAGGIAPVAHAAAAPRITSSATPSAALGNGHAPTPSDVLGALDRAGAKVLNTTPGVIQGGVSRSHTNRVDVGGPLDRSPAVQLRAREADDTIRVGIPGGNSLSKAVVRRGISIFANEADATAVAVNPLDDGDAQLLVSIGSGNSPTRYRFPITVPDGASLALTEDGGAEVTLADGTLAASIAAPWAIDARQQPVATHFELEGGSLIQVVDHRAQGTAYPVLADPSVFGCDWHTSTCVKFTRSETKGLSTYVSPGVVGAEAWALHLCSKIPHGGVALGCMAVVSVYAFLLSRSFDSAASAGKCIEIHFSRIAIAQTHWKTEAC